MWTPSRPSIRSRRPLFQCQGGKCDQSSGQWNLPDMCRTAAGNLREHEGPRQLDAPRRRSLGCGASPLAGDRERTLLAIGSNAKGHDTGASHLTPPRSLYSSGRFALGCR
jgi:hypothetical protein